MFKVIVFITSFLICFSCGHYKISDVEIYKADSSTQSITYLYQGVEKIIYSSDELFNDFYGLIDTDLEAVYAALYECKIGNSGFELKNIKIFMGKSEIQSIVYTYANEIITIKTNSEQFNNYFMLSGNHLTIVFRVLKKCKIKFNKKANLLLKNIFDTL